MSKSYSELILLPSFEERFEYLKLDGAVGRDTFGFDRYLNQVFYRSAEWQKIRNDVIIRDNGCDLATDGYNIFGKLIIHHMNPITVDDITNRNSDILNPEFLICVSHRTHNALHYGANVKPEPLFVERTLNDMCPWRR